jgi:hypothetical protein
MERFLVENWFVEIQIVEEMQKGFWLLAFGFWLLALSYWLLAMQFRDALTGSSHKKSALLTPPLS